MASYTEQPSDAGELIAQAKEALEKCKDYKEYKALKALYDENVEYILSLPLAQNDAEEPKETSLPDETQTPEDMETAYEG